MKRWMLGLCLMAGVVFNCAAGVEWLTDTQTALARARAENKIVMLDFTGSDWCGWCMRLKSEVFDQPQFASFAQANLILVEVDFPRHKPQNSSERAANEQLAHRYHIEGYPTIVLINASSQEVGRTGYLPGGPKAFINELEKIPGIKHVPFVASAKPDPDQGAAAAPRQPPVFVPVAPVVPINYGDLALKGISGSKDRRLALINNQTLMSGETAKVKVHDGRVEITCKEIHEDSVLITVDGQAKELRLGQR